MRDRYTVIGRPSKWGNPFKIGKGTDREAAVRQYAHWIIEQAEGAPSIEEIRTELKGRILRCYCAPALCHGHVLACIANEPDGLARVAGWADSDPGQ